jgi:glycerophosphoryl diester phosphodiesterase
MGAAGLAQGNTLASFDAALAAGVDMIEFDVISEDPDGRGRLLVAHDHADLRARAPLELGRALEYLASDPFAGLGLDVDVKLPGYSDRVAEALRDAGVLERSLLCSMYGRDLEAVRDVVPGLPLGLSVPRVGRDYAADARTALPASAILMAYRRWLPGHAGRLLRGGRFDAIMAHWRVVTPSLVGAVKQSAGALYVWTVDDPELIDGAREALVAGGRDLRRGVDDRLAASPLKAHQAPQREAGGFSRVGHELEALT